ncbi:MAG: hypothetical protein GX601_18640 [Anaerolineales bacterium]|nr:hypothetical protein [Anaerolineales bacterium]
MSFRQVPLPAHITGALYLHNMPGRPGYHRTLAEDAALMASHGITYSVDLAPLKEARCKSPDYAAAIESGDLPWKRISFPIADFSVPASDEERAAYLELARKIAADLAIGAHIVIHCGAGIGRSGTLAIAALLASGLGAEEAAEAVSRASGGPETSEQRHLVTWVASQLQSPSTQESA